MTKLLEHITAPVEAAQAQARAAQFICQVEGAAAFLKAAHLSDRVKIAPLEKRMASARHRGWFSVVLTATAQQLRQMLVVFDKHPARGSGAGAELEAFRMLSELTMASPQLLALVRRDRTQAVKELAKHLEFVGQQFEATAALEDSLAGEPGPNGDVSTGADRASFQDVRDALLDRAGGALSLTDAAGLLGITRQALHKRIVASTALGMMIESEIAVPKLQIVKREGEHRILAGVGSVAKLFKKTGGGPWMALQFLVDPDPNLGLAPIEALLAGDERVVVQAARALLRMDEG